MQQRRSRGLVTVTGRVLDSSGKPIVAAQVGINSVSASASSASGYTRSGKDGRFRIQLESYFPPYYLSVTAKGFQNFERPRNPWRATVGLLFFKRDAITDMGDIVLTSAKTKGTA